jgi:cholesterol transport system auxiliary component
LVGLGVAGCTFLSGPPPETYNITAPASIPRAGSTSAQILVPESTAIRAVDSERIVVASGTRITYYPEAQWPDRLPKLFQARLIEAFQASGQARAAGRPGQGLSIDYQVLTDIRVFQYADTVGMAQIEISTQIMNDRNGRIVASRVFTAEVPVAENNAVAVTAALDEALKSVLVDIVRWTVARI